VEYFNEYPLSDLQNIYGQAGTKKIKMSQYNRPTVESALFLYIIFCYNNMYRNYSSFLSAAGGVLFRVWDFGYLY